MCAQCRGLCLGGTGRIWAGRLTCLDAVLLGRFEPEGEVMLAGHPRLLLFEFDLLPVLVVMILVGGPFAQNLRCIIWDFCLPLAHTDRRAAPHPQVRRGRRRRQGKDDCLECVICSGMLGYSGCVRCSGMLGCLGCVRCSGMCSFKAKVF